jgi:hypothetical protein
MKVGIDSMNDQQLVVWHFALFPVLNTIHVSAVGGIPNPKVLQCSNVFTRFIS